MKRILGHEFRIQDLKNSFFNASDHFAKHRAAKQNHNGHPSHSVQDQWIFSALTLRIAHFRLLYI